MEANARNNWASVFAWLGQGDRRARPWMVCLALVGCVAFACRLIWPSSAEMVYLLVGQEFTPAELQTISHSLEVEGLGAFELDGSRIKVPRDQFARYAAALEKRAAVPGSSYGPLD